MGLAETQRLLARLYTDGAFREQFFADPDGVGRGCGLSPDDVRQVARGHPSQAALFARSLQNKRLGEVRKLLPLTCGVLGPRAGELFRRYADAPLPAGAGKHRADASGFAAFLQRALPQEPTVPPWLFDLLRYEAGWVAAGDPACRRHVCRTHYALPPLVRSLTAGETPAATPGPALLVWWRPARRGPLRQWSIPLPFFARK